MQDKQADHLLFHLTINLKQIDIKIFKPVIFNIKYNILSSNIYEHLLKNTHAVSFLEKT